jgi:general secretion pathway protein D
VVTGVPGLVDIPVIGRLFANNRTERTETDIVLTLTPHIVRVLDITEDDLRPFKIDKDSSGPVLELPVVEPPRNEEAQPPAAPGAPGFPGVPQPIQPVKPPDPTQPAPTKPPDPPKPPVKPPIKPPGG